MKNVIILLGTFLMFSLPTAMFAQNDQPCFPLQSPTTLFPAPAMSDGIENIISQCSSLQKVAELPNGDIIFFVSGLPTSTASNERPQRLRNGISIIDGGFVTGEVLLIKSRKFNQWAIMGCNPSKKYVMGNPVLNANWEIEVTFTKGNDVVKAVFNQKLEEFKYTSEADMQKIDPSPGVPKIHF